MKCCDEHAVSPVIGVMLMIVVTVIIAAIVSGFAGVYADADKKAPVAVISCKYMAPTGVSSTNSDGTYGGVVVAIPDGGLLFTHEGGDFVNLLNTYLVVSNGDESRRFDFTTLQKANSKQYDSAIYKGGIVNFIDYDREINTGNQFALASDNDGSSVPGGYLGWDPEGDYPAFYLTEDRIATFTLVDRESGRTIAQGRIAYGG